MPLFKVTTKRLRTPGGKRLEAGMTAEVSYSGTVLSFASPAVQKEIQRQFKMKYNADYPLPYINSSELSVEKL